MLTSIYRMIRIELFILYILYIDVEIMVEPFDDYS